MRDETHTLERRMLRNAAAGMAAVCLLDFAALAYFRNPYQLISVAAKLAVCAVLLRMRPRATSESVTETT